MTTGHGNALPSGTELEGYRIETVLGTGGFGLTYRAREVRLKRDVAIKEYLPREIAMRGGSGSSVRPISDDDRSSFEYGLERFAEEAQTLVRFRHPNIVSVFKFFEAHGTAYLVMDYVEGESLQAILRRAGTLTEDELREILVPLLDGLETVHEAGYLHRDIKPANIYIRADGSPVLLDFGAARLALGEKSQSLSTIVTPGYAPPEQYHSRGKQGRPWTDIYALGATLYRAVTGDKPPEAVERVLDDAYMPAREAAKGEFSAPFLSAIDRALAVKGDDRPQSVAVWRDLLAAGLGKATRETKAPEPSDAGRGFAAAAPPAAPAPGASNLRRWLGGTMALLLVAVVVGTLYWRGGDRPAAPEAAKPRAPVAAPGGNARKVGKKAEALAPGRVFKDCAQCPAMVAIPGGAFQMGSEKGEPDEKPVHRVTVGRFAMGKYEITFAEWDFCVVSGGCSNRVRGNYVGDNGWGRGNRPVTNVSWKDAKQYVAWLSSKTGKRYRLPSEAEWEYAARAGTRTKYWWGNAIGSGNAVCYRCGSQWDAKKTAPVGSFRPNRLGLYDVHGNVYEWVEDCEHKSYAGAPANGGSWTTGGNCRVRVLRGGSWGNLPRALSSAFRSGGDAGDRSDYLGFRVARTLP